MSPEHFNILMDLYIGCAIAIILAIPIYHFVRKQSPETGWNYHGNVQTSSYNKIDLGGIALLIILYGLMILMIAKSPDTSAEAKEMKEQFSPEALSAITFIGGLITQLIPVGIVLLFVAFRNNVFELFGLKNVPWKKVLAWAGGGLFIGYVCIIFAGLVISPVIEERMGKQELQAPVQMIMEAKNSNPSMLIALILLASVVAPICEEFVFRGYLYGTIKRYTCRYFGALSSGLSFGLVHANIWSLPALTILGVIFAMVYELTGSLWTSIFMHAAFNTISIVAMLMINENNLPY